MQKGKKKKVLTILVILIAILIIVIWGFYGAHQTSTIYYKCNFGIGDNFCWFWEKTAIGDALETLEDVFGDMSIKRIS